MIQTGARSNKRKIRTYPRRFLCSDSRAAQFAILRDTEENLDRAFKECRMMMALNESEVSHSTSSRYYETKVRSIEIPRGMLYNRIRPNV